MSKRKEDSLKELIDKRVRECLVEMLDRPPSEQESLAGTVEKLLRARPMAKDETLSVLEMLDSLNRGPQAIPATGSEPKEEK